MILGPHTKQLIEKLDDVGVPRDEAIEWLDRVLAEQDAIATHSCSCHTQGQGPCPVCKILGCEVWNFNVVGTLRSE